MPRKIALDIIDNPTCCINTTPDGEPLFCPQLRTAHFGQRWSCLIFHPDKQLLDEHGISSGEGKLQRWPECKAQELPQ